MQVKRVKTDSLKGASYNPKDRTDERSIVTLSKSIADIGLIYPIAVSKDLTVIDGHRRLAACKLLQWEEVPILIVEGDADIDKIYAEVNANSKIFTGCQVLSVWLRRPGAVTSYTAKRLEHYEEVYGRAMLEFLVKKRMSIRVVQVAEKVGRYVDDTSTTFVRKTIKWICKYRGMQIISALVRLQQSPATLYKSINDGKEIKAVYKGVTRLDKKKSL